MIIVSLDEITKEEFDEVFKTSIELVEKQLINLTDAYKNLLQFRQQYRKDYSTHRITHQMDFDKGSLFYKVGTKRKIGFQIPYKAKGESK